jgi:hypothetical protein
MPVNSLINRRSEYYIAMYSAHASILENLIGVKGTIKKLLIDGGGLKAPKGSFCNRAIFTNYSSSQNKTLHAKLIYLDNLNTLSLWTGNLRTVTLYGHENIIITAKVSKRYGNIIKNWFSLSDKSRGHLIFVADSKNCLKAEITNGTIWESFKKSLNKLRIDNSSSLSLYVFSPWGCVRFINDIQKEIRGIGRISLFTRKWPESTPLWIDADSSNDSINRFVKKEELPFPHYKCVFVTNKIGRTEKLIWSYVGSANMTEQAFYKKQNIEFATFFEGEHNCRKLDKLFKQLKAGNRWDPRKPIKISKHDESGSEYDQENDAFEIRQISKELTSILSKKNRQKELDDCYVSGNPIRLTKPLCTINVSDIHDDIFDLLVCYKKSDFSLYILRAYESIVYSDKDITQLIDELLTIAPTKTKRQHNKTDGSGSNTQSFRNRRFPMPNFILDKELLKEKMGIVRKLNKIDPQRLSKSGHKDLNEVLAIWAPILAQLDK